MKRIVKLVTWYAVMCLSGGVGAYMFYSTTVELILSDNDLTGGNMAASYALMLALKYPVLYMMIIFFLVAGAIGIVCLKRKDHIDFFITDQGKAEIILYSVLQLILVVILLDGVFNRIIKEIVSMLVLSICLYFSMVWIGNIHKFLKDMG